MIKDLCGENFCMKDAACVAKMLGPDGDIESGQKLHFCRTHGRDLEEKAKKAGVTIIIEWFGEGEAS